MKTFYQPCLFISILQLNSDEVKVERDVDVVGEEDCTDTKMDEVYRPSVLCIKTEHVVSIIICCCCGVCLFAFVWACIGCVCCSMLFGEAAIFSLHWCTGEMSTC